MPDDRSEPARVSCAELDHKRLTLVHPATGKRRRPESANETTLLDVWHFLGALGALEVPVGTDGEPLGRDSRRGAKIAGTTKVFPAAALRDYRQAVFAAMPKEDQAEAMLVMPSAIEMLRSLEASSERPSEAGSES